MHSSPNEPKHCAFAPLNLVFLEIEGYYNKSEFQGLSPFKCECLVFFIFLMDKTLFL